jgi:hypothetical protein
MEFFIPDTQSNKIPQDLYGFISKRSNIEIDKEMRSILLLGLWSVADVGITVSCTMLQPYITNATVGISGLLYSDALMYSRQYFSQDDSRSLSILKTVKYY